MKVLSPEKAPSPQDPKTKEKLDFWLREFDEQLMVKMNKQLTQCKMLTGEHLSVVDFIVYCEIYQVLAMYERSLPQHLTKLHEWYEAVGELDAIKEVNM